MSSALGILWWTKEVLSVKDTLSGSKHALNYKVFLNLDLLTYILALFTVAVSSTCVR